MIPTSNGYLVGAIEFHPREAAATAIAIALHATMAPSSVFLDIPPTPHAGADGSGSSSQDHHQVLSYISRILMEEGEEEDMDPEHHALLHAEQPFAQILSSSDMPASAFLADQGGVLAGDTHTRRSSAQGTPSSAVFKFKGADAVGSKELLPADKEYSTDLLITAFFKGMEEAIKFLPTDNKLTTGGCGQSNEKSRTGCKDRHGGGDELEAEVCRTSKLVMAEPVEAGAREMFDQMMLNGYDICFKGTEGLRIAMENETVKKKRKGRKNKARVSRGAAEVVDLQTLLVHCAKAVTDDRRSAGELLKEIKQHASPTGDATQRLAYCFAEGLEARLAGTGSQVYRSLAAKRTSAVEFLEAYQLFMSTCCFRKVAFSFANKAIFNAAVGRSRLHIVDYGLHQGFGFQWPELLRWLGARDGGPPEVRITHVDLPQLGFRPANYMVEMGNRLTNCARELGVPFKYRAAQWQTVCVDDLNMEPDEALAVNDLFNFRTLMDESVVIDCPSPRDVVLNNISKMQPDVFVQGTLNGSYGTFFLSRFREAVFDYSALFDMLDATMPRESQLRLVLERDIFGWAALNTIACESEDRVERGETYRQWQVRNQRAGLRQLPLSREIVKMARDMVKNHYHKDFVIEEDQQWLLQGWKGRILFAHSTWVANGTTSGC